METLPLSRMARRLGVTAAWLRTEADAGRVPCVKAGARYLFEPQAVQTELAQRASTERIGSGGRALHPLSAAASPGAQVALVELDERRNTVEANSATASAKTYLEAEQAATPGRAAAVAEVKQRRTAVSRK